jgi:hypothetical protein
MEISPEERDRIFQEEKVRHEAQEKLKAEEKAKKATNARYGCGGCLGLIVLVGAILVLMPKTETRREDTDDTAAYVMAKQFIRERLKAPGSAEFPSQVWNEGEVHKTKLANGSYRVSAWVEAQNSFGAKLRSNWTCELKRESADSWQVTGFCGLIE